jgi:hypothetical protein
MPTRALEGTHPRERGATSHFRRNRRAAASLSRRSKYRVARVVQRHERVVVGIDLGGFKIRADDRASVKWTMERRPLISGVSVKRVPNIGTDARANQR